MNAIKIIRNKLSKYEILKKAYNSFLSRRIRRVIKNFIWAFTRRKNYISFGNLNPDKTFLVMGVSDSFQGPFSAMAIILYLCGWAEKHNMIPIVDFKNFYSIVMQNKETIGKENSWTYYFKQPIEDVSLEEVYESKRVYLTGRSRSNYPIRPPVIYDIEGGLLPCSKHKYKQISGLYKKYLHLQPDMEKELQEQEESLIKPYKNILGVSIRVEFRACAQMGMSLYNNHPVVGSLDEYIRIVENKMNEWGCDYIFIQIDDEEWNNTFVKHFGSKCLRMNRSLPHFYKNGEIDYNFNDVNGDPFKTLNKASNNEIKEKYGNLYDNKERIRSYIIECYLLSKCTCLYATKSMGITAVYFLNDGHYKHVDFYSAGYYEGLSEGNFESIERHLLNEK